MSKHYIYEIFGRKIGATNDVERRMKEQKAKEGEYRIIEEHTNAKICSIREIELQKEYNYPVDRIQYWKTLRWQKKALTPRAQKKRVASMDWEAYSAKLQQRDWVTDRKKAVSNTDWVARNKKIRKPVNQYDLEGNFIKQWESSSSAALSLGKKIAVISNAINDPKQKTAYKYIWKYAG
jgi:hypothetical protein